MNRGEFIKGLGIVGLGSVLPLPKLSAAAKKADLNAMASCILIPSETSGPYPFDLSKNTAMFRQDIREGNAGLQLDLTLTIVDINKSCAPIQSARVDIWHCNKDGYYSEYDNQPGYLGTQSYSGKTFFRGIQLTDSNGQVKFTTIYPGWYTGRVTHIHVQVFLNSVLTATTQFAFPDSLNTTVYKTSNYSAHGENSLVNSQDNVFSDTSNTQYELLDPTSNSVTGGYDASMTIGIANSSAGILQLEPETGGQFKLSQNFPNPFSDTTSIPLKLTNDSKVLFEFFDLNGRKVLELPEQKLIRGEYNIELHRQMNGFRFHPGSYIYQLSVENSNGIFRQCKLLTVID